MLSLVSRKNIEGSFDKKGSDGFSWKYLDMLNENGDGIVFIWSLGLPFLDRSKSVQSTPHAKKQRPAISVVVYQNFKQAFYLLQEYDSKDVTWSSDDGIWKFGNTIINLITSQSTTLESKEMTVFQLHIQVHMKIPNSKDILTGEIQCNGRFIDFSDYEPSGTHNWNILSTNNIGHVQLNAGAQSFTFSGRFYHDQNCSLLPLTDLGITKWLWGRFSFDHYEWIFYIVYSENNKKGKEILLRVDQDGNTKIFEQFTISSHELKSSFYGLQYPQILHIKADETLISIYLRSKVDDSPFYQRFIALSQLEEKSGIGFVEQVVPSKVGISWQQPFVRMKVHHLNASNSFWLPLFAGDQTGSFFKLLSKVFS